METIKINFGNEIRRLRVNLKEETRVLAQLKSRIEELFLIKSQPFQMKWTDSDGDEIIIATIDDLQEAIDFHTQNNSTLRIQVTPSNKGAPQLSSPSVSYVDPPSFISTPKTPAPNFHEDKHSDVDMCTPSAIPTSTSNSNIPKREPRPYSYCGKWRRQNVETERNGKPLHFRVMCDLCSSDIYGIRYKCSECDDFDLCEECEAKEIHPKEHILMKIRVPTRVQVMRPYVVEQHPIRHHRYQSSNEYEERAERAERTGCSRRRFGHPNHGRQHHQQEQEEELPAQFKQPEKETPTPTPTQRQTQTQTQTQTQIPQTAFTTSSTNVNINSNMNSSLDLEMQQMELMLAKLREMGFNDDAINRRLLIQERGEIESVIQKLTQL